MALVITASQVLSARPTSRPTRLVITQKIGPGARMAVSEAAAHTASSHGDASDTVCHWS